MIAAASSLDAQAGEVMARVARTFDLASRLLPGDLRRDVRRLYLVLRTLDDAVDEGRPEARALVADVAAWGRGGAVEGRLAAILDELAARHPGLPRDAVLDFCAGMEADLAGPSIRTTAELDTYCYQVAGTVGRLMASLLGVRDGDGARADEAARRLGGAMQRTNILRDVVPDARGGRAYLPDERFVDAGLVTSPDGAVDPGLKLAVLAALPSQPLAVRRALLAPEIARADADYAAGRAGVGSLARGRRSIVAAGLLYREILREIERDTYGGSGRRAVVSRGRKAVLVGRAALGRR